jgi:hypothetical protein
MSSPAVDRYMARLSKLVQNEMIDMCSQIVEDLEEWCSTPYPPASRPGKPPNARTGNYARGWMFDPPNVSGDFIRMDVTNEDKQLMDWLENGTNRMEPRPVIAKAERKWSRRLARALEAALEEAIESMA